MHARWRVIAPWICVVGVLGALWLAKLSPSYKQCDAHEKQYAATEKARNSQADSSSARVRLLTLIGKRSPPPPLSP